MTTSNKQIFTAPAIVEKVSTMADGGVQLKLSTPELAPAEMAILFGFKGRQGVVGFAERDLKVEDFNIPDEDFQKEFPNEKSPSERLRGVLFVLHEKRGGKPEDFEAFRRKEMERVISHYKAKIAELE